MLGCAPTSRKQYFFRREDPPSNPELCSIHLLAIVVIREVFDISPGQVSSVRGLLERFQVPPNRIAETGGIGISSGSPLAAYSIAQKEISSASRWLRVPFSATSGAAASATDHRRRCIWPAFPLQNPTRTVPIWTLDTQKGLKYSVKLHFKAWESEWPSRWA
jgi:hypothetical protein